MIWKDLLVSLKDRKSLMITLLMPAVLTTILGFAFSGVMNNEVSIGEARIAIVDMSNLQDDIERIEGLINEAARKGQISDDQRNKMLELVEKTNFEEILYRDVLGNGEIKKFLRYQRMTGEEARAALERGNVTAIVVIPERFLYNTFVNLTMPFKNPIEIEVVKHPNHTLKGDMVEGILRGFTDALSAGIIAKNTLIEAAIENNIGEKAYGEMGGLIEDIYRVGIKEVEFNKLAEEGKRPISSFQYYAVGMAVMFILYAASDGAQYAVDELKNRTYSRMILANTGLFRIFASRFIATTLFTLIQISVLVLYSKLVFKIDWGYFAGTAVLSILLAISVGALSVLLSSINLRLRDNRASLVFQAVFIQFSALVGGSFFPTGGVPIMKALGGVTVNGAAMQGYLKLMRGYHLADISSTLLMLAAITVVSFVSGTFIASGVRE
jgi:ABC-2 type transport system permease protein